MTISPILPNADINGTWARNPASGGRFDKLNDASDSTYITSPGTGSNVYQGIDFASLTILATQRIRALQFGMKYRFVTAGYVELRFIRAGEINSQVAIVQQASAGGPSPGPIYSVWYTKDPSGAEWTQGSLDSMSLRLYDKASSGAGRVAVYELYCNVDVKNQPTVATPTVTGNTTTSRPSVAWVYSDSDGDPQSAWDMIVYSSAQYGAAGFVAGQSPWVWATINQQRNDSATFQIPVDLVNSVTYKVYLRAAKIFNGQNWASTWVPSAAFTMGFEPIPAPSITVTPDNVVPHIRNQIVVDTKLNMLTSDDASFEAGLGSWVNVSNTTPVASATQAAKGAQSMRMTAIAAADMLVSTGFYPAAPGRAYTFLGQFRTAVTARSCRLEVQWFDGAGVQIGSTILGGNVTDSSANFNTQATLTATSPAGTLQHKLFARVLAAALGEQHFADAFSYSTSASTTWFAGGASQVDLQVVEFTDLTTPYGPIVNLMNPQLALGGELGNSTDGFYTRSNKDLVRFVRDQAYIGEGSIRWDVGNNTGSLLDIGAALASYDPLYTLPCVPGIQYTDSYYVRCGSGSHSLRLVLNSIDQTGAIVGSSTNGGTVSIGTAWTRISVTHTGQTGAVGARLSLENVNGDLVDIYLDAGQHEEGSTPSVWHEGQGASPFWQTVRGALTALVADQRSQLAVCWDREAPPGVHRLYRATTVAAYPSGTNGASPASSWVASKLGLLDGGTSVVLKDPANPAHDLRIRAPSLSETIGEDQSEFHPVRPQAAQAFGQRSVITSDWVSGIGGTITLQVTDDLDWYRLLQLLTTKGPLLLQFPEGGQRYVRIKGDRSWPRDPIGVDGRVTRPSRYMRTVSINFDEVDRPPVLA